MIDALKNYGLVAAISTAGLYFVGRLYKQSYLDYFGVQFGYMRYPQLEFLWHGWATTLVSASCALVLCGVAFSWWAWGNTVWIPRMTSAWFPLIATALAILLFVRLLWHIPFDPNGGPARKVLGSADLSVVVLGLSDFALMAVASAVYGKTPLSPLHAAMQVSNVTWAIATSFFWLAAALFGSTYVGTYHARSAWEEGKMGLSCVKLDGDDRWYVQIECIGDDVWLLDEQEKVRTARKEPQTRVVRIKRRTPGGCN